MKAGFYEFEFTVAFIHDYLKKNEGPGKHANVGMPTPMEESHVGYDAKIETNGHVRFFQFKRPDYIGAGRGNQGRNYRRQPYYRINITPHEWSQQHNLLVKLAKRGHEVYYVAPIFHDPEELDLHSGAEQIMEQSIWVPTQDLHLQQRGDRSCITYLSDRNYTVHSKQTQARRSEPRYDYPDRPSARRRIDREYYASLLRDLEEVVAEETGQEPDYRGMDLRSLEVSETEDREMALRPPVAREPDMYRTVTETDRARFLLHSKFRLKAITVSGNQAQIAGQTGQR